MISTGEIMESKKLTNELNETLDIANRIVDFYEEVLEQQNVKIELLETENRKLFVLLNESKDLLKGALKIPKRNLLNEC